MNDSHLTFLKERIKTFPLADYPRHSRIHPLKSFNTDEARCFIKREDELGFLCSGSKIRKYLSLMPHILSCSPHEVLLTGSVYSNHILALASLLKEHRIQPVLFMRDPPPKEAIGNYLFLRLIIDEAHIHWVSKGSEESSIQDYLHKKTAEGLRIVSIPLGGSCKEALPGSLTLALDIVRNEQEQNIRFDHIFVDSGTGLMAQALLLALSYLEHPATVHVIQVAATPHQFHTELSERQQDGEELLGFALPSPSRFSLYQPQQALSFGSFNASHVEMIRTLAKDEAILVDPIYNAKLFFEGRRLTKETPLKGNILFIHSGGSFTLSGFQHLLR